MTVYITSTAQKMSIHKKQLNSHIESNYNKPSYVYGEIVTRRNQTA